MVFAALAFAAAAVHAAQGDARLDGLFAKLKAAPDVTQARDIERQIWIIWMDSGRKDVNQLMSSGVQELVHHRLDAALKTFDQVVEMAPDFAEGWNKRATVEYLQDDLDDSVRDIRRTLALEPRHFGALSGMGLIFLERGDDAGALGAFEQVLKLNPQAVGARQRVKELRKKLRDQAV